MLLKSRISSIEIDTDSWLRERLGKFTSSEISHLMGEKPFTQGAMSYIYRKVGEDISGVAAKEPVENFDMAHGKIYEAECVRKYGEKYGDKFLITQKLIYGENNRYSCTPDAIRVLSTAGKDAYNVHTIEVKCPITYEAYIELALCENPFDVKKVERKYFYQVLDQMHNCGALTATLVIYHPNFSKGGMKSIEFRLMEPKITEENIKPKTTFPLKDEYTLLTQRKKMAIGKFEEIKEKMLCM